jgi:hypothetical protein
MLNLTPALWLSSSLALGAGLALAWRRAVLRLRASEQATRASRAELARVRATLHQRETDGAQLKRLLLAQQQINQICLEESDPQELLERSARALTEQAGYIGASVVLLSADGDHATHVGHAQCTSPSRALSANLQAGALPGCFRAALQSDATFIRNEPRAPLRTLSDGGGTCGQTRAVPSSLSRRKNARRGPRTAPASATDPSRGTRALRHHRGRHRLRPEQPGNQAGPCSAPPPSFSAARWSPSPGPPPRAGR